ncbi:MAG: hypothetical protein MPK03_04375 [Alphaproteobacteria bacterium]|nr:hypothetical protein [Alphaproteobacteria bacterium]
MTTINDNNPAAFHCPLSSSSPSTRTQSATTTPPPSPVTRHLSTLTINAVTITLALDYNLHPLN